MPAPAASHRSTALLLLLLLACPARPDSQAGPALLAQLFSAHQQSGSAHHSYNHGCGPNPLLALMTEAAATII